MKQSSYQGKAAIALAVILLCFPSTYFANNIQVSNVRLINQVLASQHTMIQFDISWENSWRLSSGPSNWDAAWIYRQIQCQ